jgi:ABC-2 type transport system permease protein
MSEVRYSPLWQLTLARLREFFREPAAVFWVYGFPLLLTVALGMAFNERPVEKITLDIYETPGLEETVNKVEAQLQKDPRLVINRIKDEDEWKKRLRNGKTDLVVVLHTSADGKPNYEFWEEPNRPESVLAKNAVQNILIRQSNISGLPEVNERKLAETGVRYIDFLLPGLIGMNIMSGGLWGVGFVIVDMRVRKLLKRFLATPMYRRDFMLSIMLSRLIFAIPEVLMLLLFGYFAFSVKISGSLLTLIFIFILGGFCFSGIGLLIACRAKTIETVSGLMNLVMLPMFIASGVFFSAERFPAEIQPLIQALPLTALNDAIRGIMNEGKGLDELLQQMIVMVGWAIVSFGVALRYFRWR